MATRFITLNPTQDGLPPNVVPVVSATTHPLRIVAENTSLVPAPILPDVLIGTDAGALLGAVYRQPGYFYILHPVLVLGYPHEFVIAPGETLYAAGLSAPGAPCAVDVSFSISDALGYEVEP